MKYKIEETREPYFSKRFYPIYSETTDWAFWPFCRYWHYFRNLHPLERIYYDSLEGAKAFIAEQKNMRFIAKENEKKHRPVYHKP